MHSPMKPHEAALTATPSDEGLPTRPNEHPPWFVL
jgi:hypothetical protein